MARFWAAGRQGGRGPRNVGQVLGSRQAGRHRQGGRGAGRSSRQVIRQAGRQVAIGDRPWRLVVVGGGWW